MIRVGGLKLGVYEGLDTLKKKASLALKTPMSRFLTFTVVKRAVDARGQGAPRFVYTVDITMATADERKCLKAGINGISVTAAAPFEYEAPKARRAPGIVPVVVGCGPAGVMAGLILAEAGLRPVIIERGKPVDERKADVELFWRSGALNENSNVAFGEGGAGAFSDGKLTTGIKDQRIQKVLRTFVECGAPEEIRWLAKPHIGTDRLGGVVKNLRRRILELGGEFRFEHQLVDFACVNNEIRSIMVKHGEGEYGMDVERLVLAVGHSARDTVRMLYEKGVQMSAKPFAVGVRVEHNQAMINDVQFGKNAPVDVLGGAEYKLSARLDGGRGVYTFCMCPGGRVVAAATEENGLVTNGMSCFARDLPNANAALLVSVSPADFGEGPLDGARFQRRLEEKTYQLGGGGYRAPAQTVGDFLEKRASIGFMGVAPTYAPGVTPCNLWECFEEHGFLAEGLRQGLLAFERQLPGFASAEAVLTAVESRSSSPVTMWRGSDFQCNVAGLLPCGEGAGHAGGIMSAAVDGIKCAEAVIKSYD